MNPDFASKFGVLTRELAFDLRIMNRLRIGLSEFDKFDEQYQKVVERFNDLKELLQTIPTDMLNTQSMRTYLTGISCYLGRYIRENRNHKDFYRDMENVDDPYEKSIRVYTEMVRCAGRNQKDY
ncbi:hypothetical protein Aeh1ORF114c [Aeromonas phage Aeh1]|uniref:Uncharacterized protein n=1 Tax=Aeromonas phage Aeh1 TaxID=2880362 RepID=Q76YX0_9CAUD|nr:hypothetical protein Aeh1p121 [Aeromonas phage Aeh1]AAQ17776.1 hypothetical protein Aeh1ORF114c [Aeromonas phage Aeh1]